MAVREQQIRQVTVAGLLVNLILCVFKVTAGMVGHSQAVVADGVHSISDMATDVMVLIGTRYWSEPADGNHPYGHGRVETLISLAMALILCGVAVGLVVTSLTSIRQHHSAQPQVIALAAALISLVVKEWLFRWTIRAGNRVESSAVIANAWHHRSDAFSSIPAALAVAGAMISPAWGFLDHLGSVVVSVFILQAAWKIGASAIRNLMDSGASPNEIAQIETVARTVAGVHCVHAIRSRHLGSGWGVDLHVLVDGDLSVRAGHDIARLVRRELIRSPLNILDVVVHVEPIDDIDSSSQQE